MRETTVFITLAISRTSTSGPDNERKIDKALDNMVAMAESKDKRITIEHLANPYETTNETID